MIKINDKEYDAKVIVAQDGTMSVTFTKTSQTLSEIEALFNSSPKIEVWEKDELVATYFDKEMRSLTAKRNDEGYDVTAYLVVSKLEESAEKVIQTQISGILASIDTITENNTATDNAVDDLGTVSAENATSIESLAEAIDDLGTLVAELVEASQSAETTPSEDESTDTTTTETTETTEA